jgi:hypothetical protein
MKPCRLLRCPLLATVLLLASCTTTDSEMSQKEKDRLAREMAREDQKQAKAQEKQLREATQGGARRTTR